MVGRHHQLDGHEFEQTLGDSGGQEDVGLTLWRPLCQMQETEAPITSSLAGPRRGLLFPLSLLFQQGHEWSNPWPHTETLPGLAPSSQPAATLPTTSP